MTALRVPTGRPAVLTRPGSGQGDQRLGAGSVQRRRAHRVVVGVDGSPNSLAALGRAITQARLRDAELDVVRVIPEDAGEPAAAAARAALREFIARIGPGGPDVPVRLRVERGKPAAVLLVVSAGAELLVIGARSHSAHGNMFGGDTVPRCLDYAQCHVDVCADHHGDN
jgi:nucleotide-binding universal stress UspA family protein